MVGNVRACAEVDLGDDVINDREMAMNKCLRNGLNGAA